MYFKNVIVLILFFLWGCVWAQENSTEETTAFHSLQLFNERKWKELMDYGQEQQIQGVDFPLLRMRTGYAAYMLGNYSESLSQYEKVYAADPDNRIALTYCWLTNLLLNNQPAVRYYAGKMSEEERKERKISAFHVAAIEAEYSYKVTSITDRGDAQYSRIGLKLQPGYRLELNQSVTSYNQEISETALKKVNNNQHIAIKQLGYYGMLNLAVNARLNVSGGINYLHTEFSNFTYSNSIGIGSLRYASPFVQLQGLVYVGYIADSSFHQADAVLRFNPLGNTSLYSITRASVSDKLVLTQVVGLKIFSKAWIEADGTFGSYTRLLGNDGLYIYDDIDTKKLKLGGTIYLYAGKHLMISAHYDYQQKQRFATTNTFNQYSITGGVQCNF
jgi:hypothetical protein